MHIVEIKATDKIEETWDLLSQHRDELATHKDIMILKPDTEKYKILEENGLLFTLALYDEKTIVGYSVNIIINNLHYADLVMAQNDIIFIHPSYRKGMWGIRLISETENTARQRGAKFMTFHGKEGTVFCDLMPRIGYGVQDIVFGKEI